MAMLKDEPLDVPPDKDMVPTTSTCASHFRHKRDMVRCFPLSDRHLIPLETPTGVANAEKALSRLKIKKKMRELCFNSLWRAYTVAERMVDSSDNPKIERTNIIRSYNYLFRHLKETLQESYEEARVAREVAYQDRMNQYNISGVAPGMEDPLDPIVPTVPVTLQGNHGGEIPVNVLVHAAKLQTC